MAWVMSLLAVAGAEVRGDVERVRKTSMLDRKVDCAMTKIRSRGWLEEPPLPQPLPTTPAICFTFQMTDVAGMRHTCLPKHLRNGGR